jgi:hypothetical protein
LRLVEPLRPAWFWLEWRRNGLKVFGDGASALAQIATTREIMSKMVKKWPF